MTQHCVASVTYIHRMKHEIQYRCYNIQQLINYSVGLSEPIDYFALTNITKPGHKRGPIY